MKVPPNIYLFRFFVDNDDGRKNNILIIPCKNGVKQAGGYKLLVL
jgi:hypothetical protein